MNQHVLQFYDYPTSCWIEWDRYGNHDQAAAAQRESCGPTASK
jgi:hypothetical protein